MRTHANTHAMYPHFVAYTDPLGWAQVITARPGSDETLTEDVAHEIAEQVRSFGCTDVAVYPVGLPTVLAWVMGEPVAIDDDHPDFAVDESGPGETPGCPWEWRDYWSCILDAGHRGNHELASGSRPADYEGWFLPGAVTR